MQTNSNYDLINRLYLDWLNEHDPIIKNQREKYIRNNVSLYDFLMYSAHHFSPFKIFRKIFSLDDLFKTFEQMSPQDENLNYFINQQIVISNLEDIQTVNKYAQKAAPSVVDSLSLTFNGTDVFRYGDIYSINKTFTHSEVINLNLNQLDSMIKSNRYYKGIPITITVDNMGQLPLEKLNKIEKIFDVKAIRIMSKDKENHSHQGQHNPITIDAYKELHTFIHNEIISKLYVDEKKDKTQTDYLLTLQVIDKLANMLDYDYEAAEKTKFSEESKQASNVTSLLKGKTICTGDAEILRNVLSCINIDCISVDGIALDDESKGAGHTWNQVKIGDIWFNVDLTFARYLIRDEKPSGDLFMSDIAFFGNRRTTTADQGKNVEATVRIGGHRSISSTNYHTCTKYIAPGLTKHLIEATREYKKNPNKNFVVPYVGSNIQKSRSNPDHDSFNH